MDRQLNFSKEFLWTEQNFKRKSFRTLHKVKLLEMLIKREKTHGKEGNFKDEKYKHKGYQEPEVFCFFIGWCSSAFIHLCWKGLFFSKVCIKVAYSVFTMNALLILTNRSVGWRKLFISIPNNLNSRCYRIWNLHDLMNTVYMWLEICHLYSWELSSGQFLSQSP